ncbi:MAG TPA: RNA-guided pseudouridylation complex pseudouridine synthase subunit Cbf5 [Nitrososphaeraceae archaeon]
MNLLINRKISLETINEAVTDYEYGYLPLKRPIASLLDYGLILLDKPPGPTSHEVVSWVKNILNVDKAGHSGTLDPGATGLLPIGLGEATKALSILLLGPKEYYALARIHEDLDISEIRAITGLFIGDIYQRPPQRSSVRREVRTRTIHEIELLEKNHNIILLRVLCQAGTYIRKLVYDIGEILGPGATMFELRRTRVSNLSEKENEFVKLHDLVDGFEIFKDTKREEKLRRMIIPVETILGAIGTLVVKDSTVDSICHGAPIAVPGISAVEKNLQTGELIGVFTLKGEIISIGELTMSSENIKSSSSGVAAVTRRLIMKPGTYPKGWKSKTIQ